MTTYFTEASFKFLRGLARHNDRAWFLRHKAEYDTHVRAPFQRLLADLVPVIAEISAHYRVDPRPVGGSLYPHPARHALRERQDAVQDLARRAPDACARAAGRGAVVLHAPATRALLRRCGRLAFADADLSARSASSSSTTRRAGKPRRTARPFASVSTSTTAKCWCARRRDFPTTSRILDDLRRRNFVAERGIDDATMLGPRLRQTLATDLAALGPFVDYLCAALDLEY